MKGGRNNDTLLLGKYSEGSVVDGFGGDHVGVHRRGLLVERSLQSFVLGGLVFGVENDLGKQLNGLGEELAFEGKGELGDLSAHFHVQ